MGFKYGEISSNWGGIKVKKIFEEKIDLWMQQFDEKEREIALVLLMHFDYYTSERINEKAIELFRKFLAKYHEKLDMVTFIPVFKEYGVGFSDEFFNKFWMANNIQEYAERNIYGLLEDGNQFEKIVILDDYSGSGKTIRKTIARCLEYSENCERTLFYILAVEMSKTACENINKFAKERKIEIEILTLKIIDKAFKQEYIFGNDDVEKKKSLYKEMCLKHKVLKSNIWGFDKTQALVSFEYNTPNNTLGLFWHEGDDFFAIFKRYKKQATSLSKIQKEAKRRKTQKNSSVIKKHVEDEKYIFLMIHLINKGVEFNYKEACEKFGMSEEQMDEAVGYLLSKNYISLSEGIVKATNKLKQMVKITKISDVDVEETDGVEVEFQQETKYLPRNFGETFQGY